MQNDQSKTEGAAAVVQQRVVKPPACMHEDYIREDGTIEDTVVETYYEPLQLIIVESEKRYLRLQCDAGGVDSETRLCYDSLINLGWTPPPEKPKAA
jgi:hypothetical protein